MVTPFNDRLKIDEARVSLLVEHLLSNGTTDIVVAGTTGESPTLAHDEKLHLFSLVVQSVAGRANVLAGTGSNDTAATMRLSQEAQQCGVDGLLLVTPYYNRPPQSSLYAHYKAVAESVSLPIMMYNVPSRTSVNMEPSTVVRLAEIDNIIAVKEAADIAQLMTIAANAPIGFRVYTGEDKLLLPALAVGAYGVVSVCSHVIGKPMQSLIRAFAEGDVQTAWEWNRRLLPVFEGMYSVVNPVLVKAALARQGVVVGGLRLPLEDATPMQCEALFKTLSYLEATLDS